MLVEDIMTQKDKLITLPQVATIREALIKMKSENVKSIIIEKSQINGAYGLITYKNILQSIVAEDGDIDLLNIYDIANIPALSVSRKLDIKYASKMMIQNSIKRLLVVDNNELYGILTMSDIIDVLMEEIK
jgi:signal-transduction protein with cAMP-binding, CBS, and nucleotidyltransferase domain